MAGRERERERERERGAWTFKHWLEGKKRFGLFVKMLLCRQRRSPSRVLPWRSFEASIQSRFAWNYAAVVGDGGAATSSSVPSFRAPPLWFTSRSTPLKHGARSVLSWASLSPCWEPFSSLACSEDDSYVSKANGDVLQYDDEVAKLSKCISKNDWSRAMDALESSGIRITAVHVVDVIKQEKNPKHALRFFLWAGHQKGYVHNAFAINAITRVWGHEKDFQAFLDIIANMHLEDYSMTPAKFSVLIKGYGWAGLTDVAMDVLNWMIKTGRRPDERHFSCLLNALLKEQQFQTAQSVLEKMKQVGVPLDVVTYTTLIDGSCKAGQIQIACNYMAEMIQNGIRPNAYTYTALFDGLCKVNEVDKALKVFEEVKEIELDTAALNTLMSGLCDYGHVDRACELFLNSGHKPDARSYAILVGGLCKVKSFKDAEKFTEEALAKGLFFEVGACAALVESLCTESRGKEACALINRLLSHGNIPDATCNVVVSSLSRSGDAYAAYKLWCDVLRYKSLSADTYEGLLDGLCKEGRLAFAKLVYKDMLSKGFAPSVGIYGALLDGFCRAGNFDEALKVLIEMVEKGGSPNGNVFNSLIHGLSKAGKVSKAVQALQKMEDAGCFPNSFTYTSLINGYCKVESPEHALLFLKRMLAQGLAPDIGTYGTLINTFCKMKRLDAGYELFKNIKERGYSPGVTMYDALIGGFCQLGQIDDAYKLLLEMLQTGVKPSKTVSEAVFRGLRKLDRAEDVCKLIEVLG